MNYVQGWQSFAGVVHQRTGIEPGRLLNLLSVIIGLVIWEYLGQVVWPVVLAAPSEIVVAWIELMTSGVLPRTFARSLQHMFAGYFIAAGLAVPLGIFMGRSKYVRWVFSPYIDALYATPTIAYLPLIIVWFGLHLRARIFMVFMLCFFEILLDTQQGIRSMNEGYLDVGESFAMSRWEARRKIFLPAALPYVFTGLRLGVGRAIRAMIVAEIFLAVVNLGALLELSGIRFQIARQLAIVVSISIVGLLFQRGVTTTERLVIPWNFIGKEEH